jgi:hypothetical protein
VETHCLNLLDTAVAVCYPEGCVTLDGEPFVAASKFGGHTFADFLAALALGAPPLTGFLLAVYLPNCRTLSNRRCLAARRWIPDGSSRVYSREIARLGPLDRSRPGDTRNLRRFDTPTEFESEQLSP